MRLFAAIIGLSLSSLAAAPLLPGAALPVLAAPDFKAPLDATWKIAHGRFEPRDGLLLGADRPEEKHAAVLWHQVGWDTGVITCEFRLDGARNLILGADTTGPKGFAHVGRVVITASQISLAEDSVKPSHTLAKLPVTLAPGQWHTLRFEWRGDEIAIHVDGYTLQTRHAFLATAKARSWIAVSGQTASVRSLTIRGEARPSAQ